jgi:NTP pyrophosphatase (non-canonical NTP hydrolase)
MVREYGDQSFKKNETNLNKADELADIFWVLLCLANQMNIDLEEALRKNIEKKTERDQNRHKENPKLN